MNCFYHFDFTMQTSMYKATTKTKNVIDLPAYLTLQVKYPFISSAIYAYCIYPATIFMLLFEYKLIYKNHNQPT